MFDEDPSDIFMEVFGQYTEEGILKDALEELKTAQDHIKSEDPHQTQNMEAFANLECLDDLEQFLGIADCKDELEKNVEHDKDKSDIPFEFDDVFESLVDNDDKNGIAGSSTDCIETSFVCSDKTEVITSSDLLGKLMSQSGIFADENAATPKIAYASRKRGASSDSVTPPDKLQKFSEADVDECCSMYSSSASSPEDRCSIRRQKNNEASKVSRANRKAKHQRLFEREKELEKDNERLRNLIDQMTTETEGLRKILVEKLSGALSVRN